MKLWPVIEEKLCCVPHPFVSVTGGGGKTTFLISFGEYLKSKGYSVLLTTSTKLGSREEENYKVDYFFTKDDELLSHTVQKGESILFAHESSVPGKLVSPREEIIKEVTSLFDSFSDNLDLIKSLKIRKGISSYIVSEKKGELYYAL